MSKLAPIALKTLRYWERRTTDRETPWSEYNLKAFSKLLQKRRDESRVRVWLRRVNEKGPWALERGWCASRANWLTVYHVRKDGTSRKSSPMPDSLARLFRRYLSSRFPVWRLVGFEEFENQGRGEFLPLIFVGDSETLRGVVYVTNGVGGFLSAREVVFLSGKIDLTGRELIS